MTGLLSAHSVTSLDVVHHADWRVLLAALPAQSVDLTITDTPYGTTACSWDTVIDLAHWWREMRRVMKPRGAVVMTASQPYTSVLVMSNLDWFRYDWVWRKNTSTRFLDAAWRPLLQHESVLVFAAGRTHYDPQKTAGSVNHTRRAAAGEKSDVYAGAYSITESDLSGLKYPTTVLDFDRVPPSEYRHPTQKPVALFEYLIRTYTHEGDMVLDPFCGSGTTAVAARNTLRRYICGDISAEYVAIARDRVRVEPFAPMRGDDDVSDLPLFAAQEAA